MRLVEPPQRLHRYVECTAAQHAKALALLDKCAQLWRGSLQFSRGVEARDFAHRLVKAEYAFVARDLGLDLQDGAPDESRIGVEQSELGHCIEHRALPVEQLCR